MQDAGETLRQQSKETERETRTYYDDFGFGQNGDLGYVMDNTFHSIQTSLDRVNKDRSDSLTFHWHAYGKQIDDGGFTDSYDSQALVTRYEKKINSLEKLSFGYGSEYKYDWGAFINDGASFNSATRGHVKDLAVFVNAGYKILNNSIKELYDTNFFSDVSIKVENNRITEFTTNVIKEKKKFSWDNMVKGITDLVKSL